MSANWIVVIFIVFLNLVICPLFMKCWGLENRVSDLEDEIRKLKHGLKKE